MSTYIVAFANGPFTHLESSYKSPLSGKVRPLRIYSNSFTCVILAWHLTTFSATPDHIHQAQFALDVKEKVLPLYEQVFDIEYPLPKLDTLVVTDFDAGGWTLNAFSIHPLTLPFDPGAMENWVGAIVIGNT